MKPNSKSPFQSLVVPNLPPSPILSLPRQASQHLRRHLLTSRGSQICTASARKMGYLTSWPGQPHLVNSWWTFQSATQAAVGTQHLPGKRTGTPTPLRRRKSTHATRPLVGDVSLQVLLKPGAGVAQSSSPCCFRLQASPKRATSAEAFRHSAI